MAVFLLNVSIDFYFYGEITIPLINFIKFNVTSPLANFYGSSPWHFHLFQSVPIILGYNLLFFVPGMFCHLSHKKFTSFATNPFFQIKMIILLNVLVFSLTTHKEFRFIYPLQPFFMTVSVFALHKLKWYQYSRMTWILPLASVVLSLLVSSFQESGSIEVMKFLHNEPFDLKSVGFIMPCHSTPWQSYLHRQDIPDLWAITCEPPLHLLGDADATSKLQSYMDESDHLYANPARFLYENFPPVFKKELRSPGKVYTHEWPEYLIIFEQLDDLIMREYLKDSSYVEYTRFFNSWSHWDSRRAGDIVVYYKRPSL